MMKRPCNQFIVFMCDQNWYTLDEYQQERKQGFCNFIYIWCIPIRISLTDGKLWANKRKATVLHFGKTKNHDKRYFIFCLQNANTLEPIREMSQNGMGKKNEKLGRWSSGWQGTRKTVEGKETLVLIAW